MFWLELQVGFGIYWKIHTVAWPHRSLPLLSWTKQTDCWIKGFNRRSRQ